MTDKLILNNPLISIVTTVKNGEKHLEQTILSVINQTYKNIEYIVIDGGSSDGSIEIIKKYESNIAYWISEKDNGIYNGMNKGIKKANGEYFAILNSDDYYSHKNVIINVAHFLQTNKVEGLHGNAVVIKFNGNQKKIVGSQNKILFLNTIIHPTLFVKKELFIKYGGFKEKYLIAADLDFSLRLIKNKHKLGKIEEELVYIRQGGASYNNSDKSKEGFQIRKSIYSRTPKIALVYILFYYKEIFMFMKRLLKSFI